MINIKEVSKHTGLSEIFIGKCYREMKDVFKGYTSRGIKNALLFNDNAYVVFDQIRVLKDKGISIAGIHEELKKHTKETPLIVGNKLEHSATTENDKEVLQAYKLLVAEKDKTIEKLQSDLLVITDGKTTEQRYEERRAKDKEVTKSITELKLLKFYQVRKKRKILEKLEQLV